MNIRLSQPNDLLALTELFSEARQTIATLGIDQWQDGYPSEAVISDDIAKGRSYVVERNGILVATFVLVQQEPDYNRIYEGQWQKDSYLAMHRVAVAVASRGAGVTAYIMQYAAEQAESLKRTSLRIDTHRGNVPMRRMLEKQGFHHRGTIFLANGAHRVAYEKILR